MVLEGSQVVPGTPWASVAPPRESRDAPGVPGRSLGARASQESPRDPHWMILDASVVAMGALKSIEKQFVSLHFQRRVVTGKFWQVPGVLPGVLGRMPKGPWAFL